MLKADSIFPNLFRSKDITVERLTNFGVVVLAALKLANANGLFDAIIALLTTALDNVQNELSDVDTNFTGQKTETKSLDQFIYTFYTFMSESEPFIARALGGFASAGYLAFYPNKQSEYSRATKTNMQTLTNRVMRAAIKYGDALDADMKAALLAFAPDFKKQYATQQGQINTVKTDRADRGNAFVNLQLVLTQTVFAVGGAFPGNVAKCASFFPFKMLYSQGKRKIYTFTNELEKAAITLLLKMNLTKNVEITLQNLDEVANYAFWLADLPTDPMPDDVLIMTVGSNAKKLKAGAMPGFNGVRACYMVKNLSSTDICKYQVAFTGVRKNIANATETIEGADMEVVEVKAM